MQEIDGLAIRDIELDELDVDIVGLRPGDEHVPLDGTPVDADPLVLEGLEVIGGDLLVFGGDEDVVGLRAHGK